jgi:hypothetical protein
VTTTAEQQRIRDLEWEVWRWKRREKEMERGRVTFGQGPSVLRHVLRSGAWRSTHSTFEAFITAPLAQCGLSADVPLIRRMISDDPATLDLLDQALQRPAGTNVPLDNVQAPAPTGNAAARALRRLRNDRPDLHQRVLAGDLSPHAAMVLAGFRHPTATVPLDDLDALARTLCRHLTEPQRRALARLLTGRRVPQDAKKRAPTQPGSAPSSSVM